MAASRRSPLMRDQWRADDDDDRHHGHRSGKERGHRIAHSPAPSSRRPEAPGSGLRIRGRAAAGDDSAQKSTPATEQSKSLRRAEERRGHHSLGGQAHSPKTKRDLADERSPERYPRRDTRPRSPPKRRRSRSPTPERKSHTTPKHRRKERSPARTEKDLDIDWRHRYTSTEKHPSERGRDRSPYRKRSYSPERLTSDSYVPTNQRRRSRSPAPRHRYPEDSYRRRSRSPVRRSRYRDEEHTTRRRVDRDVSPRSRRSPNPSDKYSHRQRATSSDRRRPAVDERRRTRSPHIRDRARNTSLERSYRSRSRSRDRRHKRDRMNHSTRPIQSILDDPARQPSPPRRIPSFDDVQGGNASHHGPQFNVHGAKPDRRHPPHIDTRQNYGTSPQYMTPTSSHHGTPHSGSPYNHGRGGWHAQQQYYQGQSA